MPGDQPRGGPSSFPSPVTPRLDNDTQDLHDPGAVPGRLLHRRGLRGHVNRHSISVLTTVTPLPLILSLLPHQGCTVRPVLGPPRPSSTTHEFRPDPGHPAPQVHQRHQQTPASHRVPGQAGHGRLLRAEVGESCASPLFACLLPAHLVLTTDVFSSLIYRRAPSSSPFLRSSSTAGGASSPATTTRTSWGATDSLGSSTTTSRSGSSDWTCSFLLDVAVKVVP